MLPAFASQLMSLKHSLKLVNHPILSPEVMLSKLVTSSVYTQPSQVTFCNLKTAVLTGRIPGTPNIYQGHPVVRRSSGSNLVPRTPSILRSIGSLA